MNPAYIAQAFVSMINAHDPDGLFPLAAPSYVFIDALGARFEGKELMRIGWREFFRLFPGYYVKLTDTMSAGNVVGLFGTAGGSYHDAVDVGWQVAAAWKVTVSGGLVSEWRVYCDTGWAKRAR